MTDITMSIYLCSDCPCNEILRLHCIYIQYPHVLDKSICKRNALLQLFDACGNMFQLFIVVENSHRTAVAAFLFSFSLSSLTMILSTPQLLHNMASTIKIGQGFLLYTETHLNCKCDSTLLFFHFLISTMHISSNDYMYIHVMNICIYSACYQLQYYVSILKSYIRICSFLYNMQP